MVVVFSLASPCSTGSTTVTLAILETQSARRVVLDSLRTPTEFVKVMYLYIQLYYRFRRLHILIKETVVELL